MLAKSDTVIHDPCRKTMQLRVDLFQLCGSLSPFPGKGSKVYELTPQPQGMTKSWVPGPNRPTRALPGAVWTKRRESERAMDWKPSLGQAGSWSQGPGSGFAPTA